MFAIIYEDYLYKHIIGLIYRAKEGNSKDFLLTYKSDWAYNLVDII